MSERGYVLTEAAAADIRSIIRYTRSQWGDAQVRRYLASLERCMADLAANHSAFQDMSRLYPSLRIAHCEHHYIFCLPREAAPALMVAIFHERMNLMTRLTGRLTPDHAV